MANGVFGDMDSIEIRDESHEDMVRFQLYVDGCRRALLTQDRSSKVKLHWQVAGPQNWPESKAMIQGILELTMIAERLTTDGD